MNLYINTNDELEKYIKLENKLTLFLCAHWCPPCRVMTPIFGALAEDAKYSNIKFAKVDIDQFKDHPVVQKIPGVPTFITYLKGEQQSMFSGPDPMQLKLTLDYLAQS
ncbi:hypothetical protein SAMD00019534_029200 [Acytostelium subglobosum LB1]|uniref:hypothetical protein n=1 Tax=Acytostelium subglobosum LB1 TaxID=1410327 RepID=UPI000644BEAF|nr:hypothetical protein SAMD00019534_029200 [Acytostelium subglobosum LB1]GAM19745.1 hypothetical protein SAMD00019534_029200 [Acytostelium subglobosum LB1]|eukprot:XP_012756507.1 hypothetical protein SAMD00019534_029200 [Acytostelium subglobosum LB1]